MSPCCICHILTGRAEAQGARQEVTLVALGDSLTAGYGLAPADGFAPKLETYLRARAGGRVVNGGCRAIQVPAGWPALIGPCRMRPMPLLSNWVPMTPCGALTRM